MTPTPGPLLPVVELEGAWGGDGEGAALLGTPWSCRPGGCTGTGGRGSSAEVALGGGAVEGLGLGLGDGDGKGLLGGDEDGNGDGDGDGLGDGDGDGLGLGLGSSPYLPALHVRLPQQLNEEVQVSSDVMQQ
jgi:hypothetical protein